MDPAMSGHYLAASDMGPTPAHHAAGTGRAIRRHAGMHSTGVRRWAGGRACRGRVPSQASVSRLSRCSSHKYMHVSTLG